MVIWMHIAKKKKYPTIVTFSLYKCLMRKMPILLHLIPMMK
jgi:hypothetical protein